MTIELRMLAWSIVLALVYLMFASALVTRQRGMRWNASSREAPVPPLVGLAGRADRAWHNYRETFALFAAAVLAVVLAERGNHTSALGAQLYVWARVAYLPVYAAGIPYLRSAIWVVSMVGLLMVLSALF